MATGLARRRTADLTVAATRARVWFSQGYLKRLIELMRSMDGIVCENATRVIASLTSYMVANLQMIDLGLLPILMAHLDPKKVDPHAPPRAHARPHRMGTCVA